MRVALVLLLIAVLAGCTNNGSTPTPTSTTATPTASTPSTPTATTPVTPNGVPQDAYQLALAGVPSVVEVGTPFHFTLFVNGSTPRTSDHVGAHYGANSTADSPIIAYSNACDHQAGSVPGVFDIVCNVSVAGALHLRGHMRVNESGATTSFWSDEVNLTAHIAVANYSLSSPNATAPSPSVDPLLPTARANQPYTFTLHIVGPWADQSDHIGAHYGYNTSQQASTAIYDHACQHQSGAVPGDYVVTCTFSSSDVGQSLYLRGHMRITVGSTLHDFWTPEYQLTVLPL